MSNHLSSFKLEAILCGELDPDKEPEVKAHLNECAICTTYLKKAPIFSNSFETKFSSVEILLERQSPIENIKNETVVDKIKNALSIIMSPRPVLAFGSIVIAFAFSLFLFLPQHDKNPYTIKGSGFFELWINGNKVSENTIRVKAGDTLQFGITSNSPLYYAIYFQDDNGPMERYGIGEEETILKAGKPESELLPNSIILNNGWKKEIIYAFLSKLPITEEQIKNRHDDILVEKFYLSLE